MKKSYEDYIMYGALTIIVGALLFTVIGMSVGSKNTGAAVSEASSADNFEVKSTGSTAMGDVSVDLQPHKVQDGKLIVDIWTNTHSVSLDNLDLKAATTFIYDNKELHPVAAPKLSGHHNSGSLVFEVNEDLDSFTIVIKGIPKIEERVFEWK